jgi:hypothetical protein
MDVQIKGNEDVLNLSRFEFLLLTEALNEHLPLPGHRFDVLGFRHDRRRLCQ